MCIKICVSNEKKNKVGTKTPKSIQQINQG